MIDPAVLETVSVPLALEDAVPVLLSTAGFVVIARSIGRRLGAKSGWAALAGAFLIGLGGAAKVTWKVVAAAGERDLAGVDDLLFPLLALGFYLLTALLLASRAVPADVERRLGLLLSGVFGLAVAITSLIRIDHDLGLRIAMIVAVVGSLTFSIVLIRVAAQNGDRLAAILLEINVLATLGLAGLARAGEQTLGLQWIEQSINTVSQGLFLVAALRLARDEVDWRQSDTTEARQSAPVA